MTAITGYADQAKSADGKTQFVTVAPVREQQYALDVVAHAFTQRIGTDTAETGSTTRVIKATGHAALRGDVIGFTSGNLDKSEYRVLSVTADEITTAEVMREAPANGDDFEILRQRTAVLGGDGSLGVSFSNDTDYGAVGGTTLRTAAQIGNETGAADFGAGTTGAQTLRVVIVTDQSAVPVGAVQQGIWDINDISGTISLPTGAATEATLSSIDSKVSVSNLAYTAKGKLAGTSLTGSYQTLLNPTSDLRMLAFFNSCDNTILISLDGGTTDSLELEAGESITLDLAANGLKFDNTVNISAKHAGAAPTAGTIRVSGVG